MSRKTPKGISKCRAPGFSDRGSKSWVKFKVLLNDGLEVDGHFETKGGRYFYFELDGSWRCGKIADFAASTEDLRVIDLRHEVKQPRVSVNGKAAEKVWVATAIKDGKHYIACGHSGPAALTSLSEYLFVDTEEPITMLDDVIENKTFPVECWEEEIYR